MKQRRWLWSFLVYRGFLSSGSTALAGAMMTARGSGGKGRMSQGGLWIGVVRVEVNWYVHSSQTGALVKVEHRSSVPAAKRRQHAAHGAGRGYGRYEASRGGA